MCRKNSERIKENCTQIDLGSLRRFYQKTTMITNKTTLVFHSPHERIIRGSLKYQVFLNSVHRISIGKLQINSINQHDQPMK